MLTIIQLVLRIVYFIPPLDNNDIALSRNNDGDAIVDGLIP